MSMNNAQPYIKGPYKKKAKCNKGHLLDGENLQINVGKLGREQRTCITCRLDRDKLRRTSASERIKGVAYSRKWRASNPERAEYHERKKSLSAYGLTPESYDGLLESQNNLCAICFSECKSGRRLSVDHDHITGKVRGLLCGNCNQGIGRFSDRPDLLASAIKYLNRNTIA